MYSLYTVNADMCLPGTRKLSIAKRAPSEHDNIVLRCDGAWNKNP